MDDDQGYDLQPVDYNPFAPIPKAGQTVPPVNARPMTGQAAMSALGIPDISSMTPDEQQMFALAAVPMLAAGPEGRVAEEAAPAVARGIRAFHGSPYDFSAFDMSKIGTGEGAQAYGHGLYFAENPEVAQTYKVGKQTGTASSVPGPFGNDVQMMDVASPKMYEVNIAADPEHFLDWDKPLSEQHPKVQQALGTISNSAADELRQAIAMVAKQPETSMQQQRLAQLKQNLAQADSGKSAYELLGRITKPQELPPSYEGGRPNYEPQDVRATRKLQELGIPGIKYRDQGSRVNPEDSAYLQRLQTSRDLAQSMGDPEKKVPALNEMIGELSAKVANPTHNYVVFDDRLIDIIKKYGLAGLIAGGAAHFSTQPVDHQPDFEEGRAAGGRVKGLATKAQAHYRGGNFRWACAWCTMFVKPSSCTSVRGHISPRALCDFYEPEKGHERLVDNKHDVITGANSSKKPNGTIFIDRHIPEWSPTLRTKDGKRVRLWTYLSVHEDEEQRLMEEEGKTYDKAHEAATLAEQKKAEADGVNWVAYTKEIDKYLEPIEREKASMPPEQPLHVKPEAALKGEGHHHSSHKRRK